MSEYLLINGRFKIMPTSVRKYKFGTTTYFFDYSYVFPHTYYTKDINGLRLEMTATASCGYSISSDDERNLDVFSVKAREIVPKDGEEWATSYIEKHWEDLERELAYYLGHGFIDHFIKDVEIRSI